MIVLAIDTAGVNCSAALYDAAASKLLAGRSETIGKGHAERLTGMIDEVFAESDMTPRDIGLVGVAIGPGSFTGIRVGVAAARGFALALSVPVIGVTTLEVLAAMSRAISLETPILAAIDAKRGEIYAQLFDGNGLALTDPQALVIEDAQALAATSKATIAGSGGCAMSGQQPRGPDLYDIAIVAKIAASRPNVTDKAAPLYLRSPDAKPQAGYAIERSA